MADIDLTREQTAARIKNAVQCAPESLTEEQKAQARANIGAATVAEVIAALPIYAGEVEDA